MNNFFNIILTYPNFPFIRHDLDRKIRSHLPLILFYLQLALLFVVLSRVVQLEMFIISIFVILYAIVVDVPWIYTIFVAKYFFKNSLKMDHGHGL